MKEYFKLVRQVLKEERLKREGVYYEAHHIIPQSFNKVSTTVLLTPEEHYRCHKYLAEHFKNHSIYGKKMLWGYHRLSYDGKRKMTEEEYGEARRILQTLWKKPKTEKHKDNIRRAREGKKTVVHPETSEIRYILEKDLQQHISEGWENTNYTKGLVKSYTPEGREKLAEARRREQTGKTGLQAQAAKGPYTVEFKDGRTYTEGSYPELAKASGIKMNTLHYRHAKGTNDFLDGWKIYGKDGPEKLLRNTNNNSRVFKGMKSDMTLEGREKLAEARRKDQTGKTGLQAKAAKGPYTVEFEDGRTYTEGSYPELAKTSGLKMSTLQHRHVKGTKDFLKGWKVY